jgi:hypothetical protein
MDLTDTPEMISHTLGRLLVPRKRRHFDLIQLVEPSLGQLRSAVAGMAEIDSGKSWMQCSGRGSGADANGEPNAFRVLRIRWRLTRALARPQMSLATPYTDAPQRPRHEISSCIWSPSPPILGQFFWTTHHR